ncbi:HAAS signaling domain-containing protein [Bacillus massiliglaciei]|uniref:HAAS signaling domain-containing protein n=1 Tax=Bacillus massiliglaciei TaxID=1816693 RepID=UPI000A705421|nr:permease prefix domain 1-containing protein [Bacillus massiliglaciei]
MVIIERYVYAVTQNLPQPQRDDIAKELRSLIEDMLEERVQEGRVTEQHVEEVLLALGEPRILAEQYRGTKRYLIGPELFGPYILVLKMTVIAAIVVIGSSFGFNLIVDPSSILDSFQSVLVDLVTGLPFAFGWTTFVFAMIQVFGKRSKKVDLKGTNSWKPSKLPAVPHPKGQIRRGEVITGIIFYIIGMMFFSFSSEYLGVWLYEGGKFSKVIPFFNEETYGYFLLFILLIFGMGIIKECLKLVYSRWTMKLALVTAIVNAISIIGVLFVVSEPAIWNPSFMNQLTESGLVAAGSEAYYVITAVWERVTLWLFILFIIGLVWEAANGFIKAQKANNMANDKKQNQAFAFCRFTEDRSI